MDRDKTRLKVDKDKLGNNLALMASIGLGMKLINADLGSFNSKQGVTSVSHVCTQAWQSSP